MVVVRHARVRTLVCDDAAPREFSVDDPATGMFILPGTLSRRPLGLGPVRIPGRPLWIVP